MKPKSVSRQYQPIERPELVKILTGRQFGRLFVGDLLGRFEKKTYYYCQCVCGAVVEVRQGDLISGRTQSCGCLYLEKAAQMNAKYGDVNSSSSEYNVWCHMKRRCYAKSGKTYHLYGGRGIRVCDRWLNSFEDFYADMGPKPQGKSIDRIDNDGDYEPDNCRWATPKQQSNNTRRNNLVTFDGVTLSISEWARRVGIHQSTLSRRLATGWSEDRALRTPSRNKSDGA